MERKSDIIPLKRPRLLINAQELQEIEQAIIITKQSITQFVSKSAVDTARKIISQNEEKL